MTALYAGPHGVWSTGLACYRANWLYGFPCPSEPYPAHLHALFCRLLLFRSMWCSAAETPDLSMLAVWLKTCCEHGMWPCRIWSPSKRVAMVALVVLAPALVPWPTSVAAADIHHKNESIQWLFHQFSGMTKPWWMDFDALKMGGSTVLKR